MASRLAVRYIPLRFSSNATRNLISEGKAIDHSLPSINQITVKPSTTIDHRYNQSRPDQFSRQEFNHLEKRVNRVEERAHGIEKTMIKGVDHPEHIDKRFEKVEERVKEVESEVGLVRKLANDLTNLERKVDGFYTAYCDDSEERLRRDQRLKHIDDGLFSEVQERVCELRDEVREFHGAMQNFDYLNERNEESISEVGQRLNQAEEKVKEIDEKLLNKAKEVAEDFTHLERQVTDVAILNFKNAEERIVNQFEERMKLVEQIGETIKKVEERMKNVEETTHGAEQSELFKAVEDRLKKLEAEVRDIREIDDPEFSSLQRSFDGFDKRSCNIEEKMCEIEESMKQQIREVCERLKEVQQPESIDKAIKKALEAPIKKVEERMRFVEGQTTDLEKSSIKASELAERSDRSMAVFERVKDFEKQVLDGINGRVGKLEARMNEVEERTHGTEKSMVKGVEQSEHMPLVERVKQFEKQVIDGIDGRVGKLEARMNEAEKSTTEGVEGVKEFKKEVCKTLTYLDRKVSDVEPMIKSISKVEESIRKVEERLKKVEQPGRMDKTLKVLEERMKKLEENRKEMAYLGRKSDSDILMNYRIIRESIQKNEEKMKEIERKVKRNPCVYLMYGAGVYAGGYLLDHILSFV